MKALPPSSANTRRTGWLKTLHQWHWISSAVCLVGMLLFAFTGITLNHGSVIEAQPQLTQRQLQLPAGLLPLLQQQDVKAPLPPALRAWLAPQLDIRLDDRAAEWSTEEVYVALPRPGGDAWLRVDRASGAVEYERTERGWIAYLNDLHKGRNTGTAWTLFIDIFAVACLIFSISGLLILKFHALNRPGTWPLVGLGLLVPALLALLLFH